VIALPDWADAALAADYGVTTRQLDILAGIAKGMTNADIGRALFLSEETVKTHIKGLYRALRLSGRPTSRGAAVAIAYDVGLLRTRAMRNERAQAAGLQVAS
jgi:DNA-binding NarL/FixJ family response regulator